MTQLRSGKILKTPKVTKKIHKYYKPVSKISTSKRPSSPVKSESKNIRKTRSIADVQLQGISFLKNSDRVTRQRYTISKLQNQNCLMTRSKDPKISPFSMVTRSKDTTVLSSLIKNHQKKETKKVEKIPEQEDKMEEEEEVKEDKKEEEKQKEQAENKKNIAKKYSSKFIQDLAAQPSFGLIDVVFCCDTTYSMQSYIEQVKQAIRQISKNIVSKVGLEGIDVKFGFVGYQDHAPQQARYVTKVHDLDTDINMISLIDKEECYGGGDNPEAVLDGLNDAAIKISWRYHKNTPYLRYVYHICDAPPHGEIYSNDSYDFKKGCPCNLTAEKISDVYSKNQIHYRLIKTTDRNLEKMTAKFKSTFQSFDQYTLKEAPELNVRVSDMFNNEVFPEFKQQ